MINYIAKEDIPEYPLIDFQGNVVVIDAVTDLSDCCKIIHQSSVVGFDTETKPAFQKGVIHDISLIQLSVDNTIFLFRINKIGLDQKILDILSSPHILKVGIDIKNDISGLMKIKKFQPSNFLDLNQLAINKGFKSIGAVKLAIMLLGYRISKRQRLSDWSADTLTAAQIEYAAVDAWICPKILQAFKDRSLFP